eukprot:scaffold1184_cov132-Cylindrotheca_fusiformis.AAC.80
MSLMDYINNASTNSEKQRMAFSMVLYQKKPEELVKSLDLVPRTDQQRHNTKILAQTGLITFDWQPP